MNISLAEDSMADMTTLSREELEHYAGMIGADPDRLTPKQREAIATLRSALDAKQEQIEQRASQGGKARAKALSKAKRQEIARKGAEARAAKTTPEQRREIARKASQAAAEARKEKARLKRRVKKSD